MSLPIPSNASCLNNFGLGRLGGALGAGHRTRGGGTDMSRTVKQVADEVIRLRTAISAKEGTTRNILLYDELLDEAGVLFGVRGRPGEAAPRDPILLRLWMEKKLDSTEFARWTGGMSPLPLWIDLAKDLYEIDEDDDLFEPDFDEDPEFGEPDWRADQ